MDTRCVEQLESWVVRKGTGAVVGAPLFTSSPLISLRNNLSHLSRNVISSLNEYDEWVVYGGGCVYGWWWWWQVLLHSCNLC